MPKHSSINDGSGNSFIRPSRLERQKLGDTHLNTGYDDYTGCVHEEDVKYLKGSLIA